MIEHLVINKITINNDDDDDVKLKCVNIMIDIVI